MGLAAHSMQSLRRSPTASFGLVLALLGHAYGWPMARGGSQAIADALVSYLRSLGAIETGRGVASVDELPPSVVPLLDLTPRGVIGVAGQWLPDRYLRALRRYATAPASSSSTGLSPDPCLGRRRSAGAREPCTSAARRRRSSSRRTPVWRGEAPGRPYMIVAQQSLFDETRAPAGHTLWAYCHIPNGSTVDMTERMEAQIERFAPGFRDLILARHAMSPAVSRRATRTTSAGTSTAASRIFASSTRGLPCV